MDTEDVRLAVYESFATTGRAPDLDALADRCRLSPGDTREALRRLSDARHLVLDGAHFLVPARDMWKDVLHTCSNQRLFCRADCVDAWLERTGNRRGYVMDLATLWTLAGHWYDGRLERGYTRREPAAAIDYFRAAGLTGPFWEP